MTADAYASVNFATAHDGLTLADLGSYNTKHNEANGEGNCDGLGRSGRDGALVAEAVPNGPAAGVGIRVDDLVVAFQGKPIRRADERPRLTAKAPVGSEIDLTLIRGGQDRVVRVCVGELPEPRER